MSRSGVLVLAEHNNEALKRSTHSVLNAALQLSEEITVLVVGSQCQKAAEMASFFPNIKKVIIADAKSFKHGLAENVAPLIVELSQNFHCILAPATTFGKNILPRVAALLDVSQVSEITQIISNDTFLRPIYAGNAEATVQSFDPVKVITVRPSAFEPIELGNIAVTVESYANVTDAKQSQFIKEEQTLSKRPELSAARVVVAGGRGLMSQENFKLLEEIADLLHGAIGASRAAVDAGFIPNEFQIGQTGKVVAPDLYIAVGISGAIQHLAGMKESKVIVAINKDPDAPIFQVADYKLVGDLFQILPELSKELASRMGK